MELQHLHPQPPALRVFDAGMGDGTVLTRVMRKMHTRFPTMPFYITGKEVSLEDVRLTLDKMPDRFYEHPATVLVVTNLYYTEAPWLTPRSLAAAASLEWHEVPLQGTTAHEFEQQITALQPFLAQNWNVRRSAKTGNPLYNRPTVLVLYRDDYHFMLDQVIPHPGRARRLRPRHRLAALPCPHAGRLQGGEGGSTAGQGAGVGRPSHRHPFLGRRPGHGGDPQCLAAGESLRRRPPRHP